MATIWKRPESAKVPTTRPFPRFRGNQKCSLCTVVNHLQVERLSFVNVVQVFHGDDEAELQDGQAWEHGQISLQILIRHVLRVTFTLTVQHVCFAVCETKSAGLQQVGRSDGRPGDGDPTQTEHLERRNTRIRHLLWRIKREEDESYQQNVQRAEVCTGVKVSLKNLLHRFVLTQTLKHMPSLPSVSRTQILLSPRHHRPTSTLPFQSRAKLSSAKSCGRLSWVLTRSRYWGNVGLFSRWIWRCEKRDLTRFSSSSRTSWRKMGSQELLTQEQVELWVAFTALPACRSSQPQPQEPGRTGRHQAGCKAGSGSYGGRTGRTRPGRTEPDGCCCDRLARDAEREFNQVVKHSTEM